MGSPSGFGKSYSYGQQGRSQSALPSTPPGYYGSQGGSYQNVPGGGQRDIGSPNYWDRTPDEWNQYIAQQGPIPEGLRNYPNQGRGSGGGGGYPGQQQRMPQPPAGKGRGMGGIGGGPSAGIAQQHQARLGQQDPYYGMSWFDKQMMWHQKLQAQRQMEAEFGAPGGHAWEMPQQLHVPSYFGPQGGGGGGDPTRQEGPTDRGY